MSFLTTNTLVKNSSLISIPIERKLDAALWEYRKYHRSKCDRNDLTYMMNTSSTPIQYMYRLTNEVLSYSYLEALNRGIVSDYKTALSNINPKQIVISMLSSNYTISDIPDLRRSLPQENKHMDMLLTQKASHFVRCYIDEEKQSLLIYTNFVSAAFLLLLPTLIPKLCNEIPNDFRQFLVNIASAIISKNETKLIDLITESVESKKDQLHRYRIEKGMEVFEKLLFKDDINSLVRRKEILTRDYQDAMNAMQRSIFLMDEVDKGLLAINTSHDNVAEKIEDFKEFLHKSPYMHAISPQQYEHETIVDFTVVADAWTNENSFKHLYETDKENYLNTFYYKEILEDVFITNKAKLKLTSMVRLLKRNSPADISIRGINNEGVLPKPAAIVNPHIGKFNCFGNNSTEIIKAFKEYDFKLMFLQIVNSVGNVNFADSGVVSDFLVDISTSELYRETACLERDGKLYTFKDYYEKFIMEEIK